MYFRFPRHHVDISGRDVTELYMAINSPRSSWQCLKSAWPYLLNIWEFIHFVWGLSPKRCVVRRRNFASRRVPTMCRTCVGF